MVNGILQNQKAVFYIPCDQLPPQEIVQSQIWTDYGNWTNGGTPGVILDTGIVLSGFKPANAGAVVNNDFIIAHPSASYQDITNSSGLCVAYWAKGPNITSALPIKIGFGSGVAANLENGIEIYSSNAFFKTTLYASGISASKTTFETNTNPIFIVVDVRFSGGTTWLSRRSINGGPWSTPDTINLSGNFNNSSFAKVAFGVNLVGDNTLDETILWSDNILFTNQELSNLFELGNTFIEPMTSYASRFDPNITSWSGSLYTTGTQDVVASGDMTIGGIAVAQTPVASMDCFINGISPKPSTACPVLDPLASIQVASSLIKIYQSRIDALINQLGKNVHLEFDPIITPCPNCSFDRIRKRSTGIYIPGGPRPFQRGRQCPWCKGHGLLETAVVKCIKCLIKWQPQDAKNYGISLTDKKGIVRLKTFLTEADDLIRAKTIIANFDIKTQLKLRVKLIKGPIPVGLREDRYCISFWELL